MILLDILSVFINVIRIILIILAIFHIYKRQKKMVISLGIVFAFTFLPRVLEALFGIKMDLLGNILYFVLIVMTIYLGSTLKFYDKFSWWDRLIHFLSGIAFVSFGIAISIHAGDFNRLYILFFCLSLSIFLHVIWEVLEYAHDSFYHKNNQRWQRVTASNNHKPESAIQPSGLVDTMNDTIICMVSTVITCFIWWFIL